MFTIFLGDASLFDETRDSSDWRETYDFQLDDVKFTLYILLHSIRKTTTDADAQLWESIKKFEPTVHT